MHLLKLLYQSIIFFGFLFGISFSGIDTYVPSNGDIIFHTSQSSQSKAIEAATNSPYTHMGILYVKNDNAYVFEAAKTVKLTPLWEWIQRGKNNKYVVKRLKNADELLTATALKKT